MQSFNPRTHTGCDVRQIGKEVFNVVSIHAPTRGATVPMENCGVFPVFQSTHPHGVRLNGRSAYVWTPSEFQSTHPHGVRQIDEWDSCQYSKFQSTHPHGVRLSGTDTCSRFAGPSFNPRTHTGCDSLYFPEVNDPGSFNPRTHTGCDVSPTRTRGQPQSFNPRTHTGCDSVQSYIL